MKKFYFRSISLQQPAEQLAILRAHSSTIAFAHNRRNTYLLATTVANMKYLIQILGSNEPPNNTLATTQKYA